MCSQNKKGAFACADPAMPGTTHKSERGRQQLSSQRSNSAEATTIPSATTASACTRQRTMSKLLVSNIKETLSHPEFRRARDCQASSKTSNGSAEVAFPIRRRHAAAFPALAAVGRSPDHIEGPVPAGRQRYSRLAMRRHEEPAHQADAQHPRPPAGAAAEHSLLLPVPP